MKRFFYTLFLTAIISNTSYSSTLVIGDSISLGWMPELQHLMPDTTFIHAEHAGNANSQGTRGQLTVPINETLRRIDLYIESNGGATWDRIIINAGIWDMRADAVGTTPTQYRANLQTIHDTIEDAGIPLLWLTTTPVPCDHPTLNCATQASYRSQELAFISDNGLAHVDLYEEVFEDFLTLRRRPEDLHFSPAGSRFLAERIQSRIEAIPEPSTMAMVIITLLSGTCMRKRQLV